MKQNNDGPDYHGYDFAYPDILSTELERATFPKVGVSHIRKGCLSNEQKTSVGKQILQQAPSAVEYKLNKKTLCHIGCRQSWRI
jgi:hypothetical protein